MRDVEAGRLLAMKLGGRWFTTHEAVRQSLEAIMPTREAA